MNEEKDLEHRLSKGFEKIDNANIPTPDIMYFNELVKGNKALQQKKQNLQFAVFIAFSIVFVSFLFSLIASNAFVFITLQLVAFVFPLIWLLSKFLYRTVVEARVRR